jgi:PAS domain S-box-containing protein
VVEQHRRADRQADDLAILDRIPIGLLRTDPTGRILRANVAIVRMLGYPDRSTLMARSVYDLYVNPEERERLMVAVSEEGATQEVELHWRRHSGQPIWVRALVWAIRDAEGRVLAYEGSLEDVSEARRLEHERRLQAAALQAAANAVVITDREGRIVWVNPAFTSITGYEPSDVLGQAPNILKSGQHGSAFYLDLWATILSGRIWHGELVNRRKDGTLYTEEMTITPVRSPEGAIEHFVAVKRDVSERERSRETLRRSEEYYRALIENALDVVVVLNADGTYRYASPAVERILGYRPGELVGTNAFDLIHEDDVARIRGIFDPASNVPGFAASAQYRVRHRDGTWRVMEATGSNLVDVAAVAGIVVNARDVTERMRAEEAERRLQSHLAQSEKLAAMGELLAGVAHELNNPLSVVLGYASILVKLARDGAADPRVEKIRQAAERCARIVKNFLMLGRQHAPESARVDLNGLVRDTLEMLAYPLRIDTIEVALDLADGMELLWADPHQLQQVITNLVTNAHHAMREIRGPRRLTIATGFDGGSARASLVVTDTGPGIPSDVERRLFEPFYTTKPLGQGTGLGLPICKGIVEGHGGTISVEGRPGEGARFIVSLPVGAPATGAEPIAPEPAPEWRGRTVLVIDDEAAVADVTAEILAAEGLDVTTVNSAAEALGLLDRASFDVILMDIKMPGLDGPGLYREVQRRRPDLLSRFVFFTGDVLNPVTRRFLDEIRAPYVTKPFDRGQALAALQRVLAPSRGRAGTPGPAREPRAL